MLSLETHKVTLLLSHLADTVSSLVLGDVV